MKIDDNSTRVQSLAAYNQWCVQWREHAKIHSKYPMKNFNDFVNIGVGKAVVAVANGASLESEIEIIKEYQDNIDILCCDKTLGHLISNGIRPTYCIVCDANVDYEKYLKPFENELKDTILFTNVCANPLWTDKEWKDRYFFVNKDVLNSEIEFSKISGCKNIIVAGTNVSNAMIILLTQCNEKGRDNFFGYDKIILVGFDYCWTANGNYYAFDKRGNGKHNYMRHLTSITNDGSYCYTSSNLEYSCSWLAKYFNVYKNFIFQTSKKSILNLGKTYNLKDIIGYNYKSFDRENLQNLTRLKQLAIKQLKEIDTQISTIAKDHVDNILSTI